MKQSAKSRILFVDDSDALRETYAELLALRGYQVEVAADGQEALENVRQGEPDLVIMDFQMPVMDGEEAILELRATGFSKPIIAFSARDVEEWMLKVGATAFLQKPIDPPALFQAIDSQLSEPSLYKVSID